MDQQQKPSFFFRWKFCSLKGSSTLTEVNWAKLSFKIVPLLTTQSMSVWKVHQKPLASMLPRWFPISQIRRKWPRNPFWWKKTESGLFMCLWFDWEVVRTWMFWYSSFFASKSVEQTPGGLNFNNFNNFSIFLQKKHHYQIIFLTKMFFPLKWKVQQSFHPETSGTTNHQWWWHHQRYWMANSNWRDATCIESETLFLLDSFSLPVKFGIVFFSPQFLDEMKQESTLCTLPEVYNGSPLKNYRIQKGKQLSIHFSGANSLVKLRGCIHPGKLT